MKTYKDLIIWKGSQIDLEKKIDDELRNIKDMNSLELYIKSQVALFKNKVWKTIFEAKTENKRKKLDDIQVDTQIKQAETEKILAGFELNNIDETIEIKRLKKQREKAKINKDLNELKKPKKSGIDLYKETKEAEAAKERIDKDIAAREQKLDTLRELFKEFDTITEVLERTEREKLKIMEKNTLTNEEKLRLIANIDAIANTRCYELKS